MKKQYMKYAEKETPARRKLKAKLEQEFEYDTTSSSDSDDNSVKNKSTKRRKTNQDVARETQEVHKDMCVKAMDTLDRVNNMLANVEKQIAQKNQ